MTVEIIEPGSILVLILACPGIDLDYETDSDLGDRSDSCFCWCY